MCVGKEEGPTGVTGIMWEMPLLAELPLHDGRPLPIALKAVEPDQGPFHHACNSNVKEHRTDDDCSCNGNGNAHTAGAENGFHTDVGPVSHSSQRFSAHADGALGGAAVNAPGADRQGVPTHNRWFFSISPDACTSPTFYFLGDCPTIDTFDLEHADGPYKFDIGDTFYAPNLFRDPQVRHRAGAACQQQEIAHGLWAGHAVDGSLLLYQGRDTAAWL